MNEPEDVLKDNTQMAIEEPEGGKALDCGECVSGRKLWFQGGVKEKEEDTYLKS